MDIYSDWSGPCSAMTNFLKKIKLEVNDDLLHYAMAKSGKILHNIYYLKILITILITTDLLFFIKNRYHSSIGVFSRPMQTNVAFYGWRYSVKI